MSRLANLLRSFATGRLPLILATALAAGGATVVVALSARADASRQAQLSLAHVQDAFNGYATGVVAAATPGLSPGASSPSSIIERYGEAADRGLAELGPELAKLRTLPRVSGIGALERNLRTDIAVQKAGYATLVAHPNILEEYIHGHAPAEAVAGAIRISSANAATGESFTRVNRAYSNSAQVARTEEIAGASVVMALLLATFSFYFLRSRKLNARIEALLVKSSQEAVTDHLTGLGNRRAMDKALSAALSDLQPGEELLVALYDLDGFKNYNDTFGHHAGDALLVRLSAKLNTAIAESGSVFRMGGDEFCLLARCETAADSQLAQRGAAALSESGEGFSIGASYGWCRVPQEASSAIEALRLADQRLYRHKGERRPSAVNEVTAALITAMAEHGTNLEQQNSEVSELACLIAESLGMDKDEVARTTVAAKLYDIGKLGIPDSVLAKTAQLDEQEQAFICRHPLIGARIITAAPSLAPLAPIVRSSHEYFDGSGFPAGLKGEEIPLAARIIAACDAYFQTNSRHMPPVGAPFDETALAEICRHSGSRFDPVVLQALTNVLSRRRALQAA